MAQPELRTGRIRLVPLAAEHLEDEILLDSDPQVMRFLGNGLARSQEQVVALHQQRLSVAELVPGLGFWAGTVEGSFVGWWILEPLLDGDERPVAGQAELGYRILRRYWRQGLASEGARELIRYGFDDLGLNRIIAQTMAVNVGSRATMAAIGLRHRRTWHQVWDEPIPGAEHGEVEYDLTRAQWLAARS